MTEGGDDYDYNAFLASMSPYVRRAWDASNAEGVQSTNRAEVMIEWMTKAPTQKEALEVFGHGWTTCDKAHDFQPVLLSLLRRAREGGAIEAAPFRSEEWFQGVFCDEGEPVPIYRGCSRSRVEAISWTLCPKVAEGFARGHRGISVPDGVVMQAQIYSEDVLSYSGGER